jgi:hypothetical protein
MPTAIQTRINNVITTITVVVIIIIPALQGGVTGLS